MTSRGRTTRAASSPDQRRHMSGNHVLPAHLTRRLRWSEARYHRYVGLAPSPAKPRRVWLADPRLAGSRPAARLATPAVTAPLGARRTSRKWGLTLLTLQAKSLPLAQHGLRGQPTARLFRARRAPWLTANRWLPGARVRPRGLGEVAGLRWVPIPDEAEPRDDSPGASVGEGGWALAAEVGPEAPQVEEWVVSEVLGPAAESVREAGLAEVIDPTDPAHGLGGDGASLAPMPAGPSHSAWFGGGLACLLESHGRSEVQGNQGSPVPF